MFSCKQSDNNLNSFISQFNEVSTEEFKGYGVYERGKDEEGNRLIYVSKTLNTETFQNSGNVVVAIDSSGQVQYTDSETDNFNLDIDTVKQIAILLESLKINSLSVDYEGKVYISLYDSEQPQLMNSPKNENYQGWERIKNYWYRKSK